MIYTKYNLNQNLIIKKPVPKYGVVCSNPRRIERIVKNNLTKITSFSEYQSAWALDLYTGEYQGQILFAAALPVGAAGAAFVIQQLAAAGATHIIRYGSNDDPTLAKERMNEVLLVDQADNLYGLMQASGASAELWGQIIHASPYLIQQLKIEARKLNLSPQLAICHHVEDYGAYAFPDSAGEYKENVKTTIKKLEEQNSERIHCRDMETAAIFYRGILDNFHAATVLQNVPKFAGEHQTYENELGELAISLESAFTKLILNALAVIAEKESNAA